MLWIKIDAGLRLTPGVGLEPTRAKAHWLSRPAPYQLGDPGFKMKARKFLKFLKLNNKDELLDKRCDRRQRKRAQIFFAFWKRKLWWERAVKCKH